MRHLIFALLSTFSMTLHAAHYNLTAYEEPKFLWFRVAKVGTRSLLHLFSNHFGTPQEDYNIPYNRKKYQGYFKFAFVRNPWDRVVSCYFNKVVSRTHPPFSECFGKSFEEFVHFINRSDLKKCDVHIRLQTALFPVDEMDFIGRLETFDEDVIHLMSLLGVHDVQIPHRNVSDHNPYRSYYNRTTRRIIAEKYKEDIEQFGYLF